ncbi:MAG: putative ABC transporter permease [Lachnospiraceae bacterium]|nr:putative ABC transporter permease [Lachnospiraceae bacterium]
MDNLSTFEAGFLIITFLFMVGSMFGWTLELFFRRFISTKNPSRKWINPGFLVGPCLPLYGFGLVVLFIMSLLPYVGQSDMDRITTSRIVWAIIAMGVLMTVLEYIAGLIFIKGMKIKLWDYSDEWGNIQGIICPKFSIIWTVLAAVYYFFVQPYVIILVKWFADNIAFSFVVGFFYGILVIDFSYSLNIVGKVRAFAVENDVVVKYETLKQEIRQETDMIKKRGRFILAFNPERGLRSVMEESLEKIGFDKVPRKKSSGHKA